MGLIWLIAAAALVILVAWGVFPGLARVVGVLLVIDSIGSILLFPERMPLAHFGWLLGGVVLWLAGHWAFAAKHGCWRSPLAMRAYRLPGLRRLRPRSLR